VSVKIFHNYMFDRARHIATVGLHSSRPNPQVGLPSSNKTLGNRLCIALYSFKYLEVIKRWEIARLSVCHG